MLSCVQLFASPWILSSPDSSVHGDSPGKNTGIGCHALLQGIFRTQGSNLGLPHCRWTFYLLSHQESPFNSTYTELYIWASQTAQWQRIHLSMQEMQETQVWSLCREDPLEKEDAPYSSMHAWNILGQRSLSGYSPWGHKESDTT